LAVKSARTSGGTLAQSGSMTVISWPLISSLGLGAAEDGAEATEPLGDEGARVDEPGDAAGALEPAQPARSEAMANADRRVPHQA